MGWGCWGRRRWRRRAGIRSVSIRRRKSMRILGKFWQGIPWRLGARDRSAPGVRLELLQALAVLENLPTDNTTTKTAWPNFVAARTVASLSVGCALWAARACGSYTQTQVPTFGGFRI